MVFGSYAMGACICVQASQLKKQIYRLPKTFKQCF